MNKIIKAVFGSGRPSLYAMGLTSVNPMLASTENGLCRISYFVAYQISEGGINK
jgi:hypothetical protein